MGYNTWKNNNKNYEIDPEAEVKNKKLKARSKTNIFYRLFFWFFSIKDKLLRELVCNWTLIISLISIIVISLVGTQDIQDGNVTLNAIGAKFFVVMIMFLLFIGSCVYKLLLKYRKRKGTYWPKFKKRDPNVK